MALDLKPVPQEVVDSMGYTQQDLWLVKIHDRVFGPFELASLKAYSQENEGEFVQAFASPMDADDWKPFFSLEHFHLTQHNHFEEEKHQVQFWVLSRGQKAGPFNHLAIQKKFEAGQLRMNDVVSMDDGYTWMKFFHVKQFNTGVTHTPPQAPYFKIEEEAEEVVEEAAAPQSSVAGLVFLGHKNEKPSPKLEEMDLKSLDETEVTRSLSHLKWIIPSAVAGVGVIVVLGNFVMNSSGEAEVAVKEEKSQVIRPRPAQVAMPTPTMNYQPRQPANYNMPATQNYNQRSALTHVPENDPHKYQAEHVETHYPEAEPHDYMADQNQGVDPAQQSENTLIQNDNQERSISGQPDPDLPPPDAPVMEETGDF